MRQTKPPRRLVSKRQYVQHLGKRFALGGVSVLAITIGMVCAMVSLTCVLIVLAKPSSLIDTKVCLLLLASVPASCIFLTIGFLTKQNVESSQPLIPLTDRNAHLLPVEETLVRGSDLPPTIQQAELLRATQAGQEIAPEELLRATAGKK